MERKAEDAHRLRLKAQEMLRLARQTNMPEVAKELLEMANLLHEPATKAEASMPRPSEQPQPSESAD